MGKITRALPDDDLRRRELFAFEFVRTGSRAKAAEIAQIHTNTAAAWAKDKSFKDRVAQIRSDIDKETDAKISRILDKTFDALEDRIDNGEAKVTKTGIVIVPVAAQTLAVVAGVLFDKRAALRKNPENDDGVTDHLDTIAEKLRRRAESERTSPQVIDVEMTETQPDEGDLI